MNFRQAIGSVRQELRATAATGPGANRWTPELQAGAWIRPGFRTALTDVTSDVMAALPGVERMCRIRTPRADCSGRTGRTPSQPPRLACPARPAPHTPEDDMSHHHYEPALEAELDYRRAKLQHGAEEHRLARLAGRATRAA